MLQRLEPLREVRIVPRAREGGDPIPRRKLDVESDPDVPCYAARRRSDRAVIAS
jgi:hypothetical protein